MQSALTEEVRSFIVSNFLLGKEGGFSNDASFLEEGIIDSTGVLELVSYLEETYRIEIGEDELNPENLDSINRVAAYLAKKLSRRSTVQPVVGQLGYPAD
jgi:acyl carrier protein